MELPKGVNMSVPDLSAFARPKLSDPIAIKVNPGDRVIVLLPQQASQQEVAQISEYLKQWAPETMFLVLSGPLSVTVIPPTLSEDKAPQGPDAIAEPQECICEGRNYPHHRGTGKLCKDSSN